MTTTTLVASDLDRTLIYSAAALGLTMPDTEAPRLLCVETYQHKPLSYVTETAAALLAELPRHALFVPATTREQYHRIRLPGPPPRYAICANGGHLLVDGVSDPDWRRTVATRLADECATLDEVRGHLLATADPAWLLKERVAEDLFAYLVVERDLLPDGWMKELAAWAPRLGRLPPGPQGLRRPPAAHQERRGPRSRPPRRSGPRAGRRRLASRRRSAPRRRPGLAARPRRTRRDRVERRPHRRPGGAGRRGGRGDPPPVQFRRAPVPGLNSRTPTNAPTAPRATTSTTFEYNDT
jgi:hypothetical protein